MNTLSIILLISTTFSLLTSLIGPLSNLIRVLTTIPRTIEHLRDEVHMMGQILGECLATIIADIVDHQQNRKSNMNGQVKIPAHVLDLGVSTYERWKEVDELAERTWRATVPGTSTKSVLWSSLLRLQRVRWIVKREGELQSTVGHLRDRVGLVRDACAE